MARVPEGYEVIRTYRPSSSSSELMAVIRAKGGNIGEEKTIILENPNRPEEEGMVTGGFFTAGESLPGFQQKKISRAISEGRGIGRASIRVNLGRYTDPQYFDTQEETTITKQAPILSKGRKTQRLELAQQRAREETKSQISSFEQPVYKRDTSLDYIPDLPEGKYVSELREFKPMTFREDPLRWVSTQETKLTQGVSRRDVNYPLISVGQFGLGAISGAAAIPLAFAYPVKSVKGLYSTITKPKETLVFLKSETRARPLFFIGQVAGSAAAGKVFGLGISKLKTKKQPELRFASDIRAKEFLRTTRQNRFIVSGKQQVIIKRKGVKVTGKEPKETFYIKGFQKSFRISQKDIFIDLKPKQSNVKVKIGKEIKGFKVRPREAVELLAMTKRRGSFTFSEAAFKIEYGKDMFKGGARGISRTFKTEKGTFTESLKTLGLIKGNKFISIPSKDISKKVIEVGSEKGFVSVGRSFEGQFGAGISKVKFLESKGKYRTPFIEKVDFNDLFKFDKKGQFYFPQELKKPSRPQIKTPFPEELGVSTKEIEKLTSEILTTEKEGTTRGILIMPKNKFDNLLKEETLTRSLQLTEQRTKQPQKAKTLNTQKIITDFRSKQLYGTSYINLSGTIQQTAQRTKTIPKIIQKTITYPNLTPIVENPIIPKKTPPFLFDFPKYELVKPIFKEKPLFYNREYKYTPSVYALEFGIKRKLTKKKKKKLQRSGLLLRPMI